MWVFSFSHIAFYDGYLWYSKHSVFICIWYCMALQNVQVSKCEYMYMFWRIPFLPCLSFHNYIP